MKIQFLGMAVAFVALLTSCNSGGWRTDKTTGLKYQIFGEGEGELIQEGDYLSINMIYKTDNDSVILDTYQSGRAIELIVQKPLFKGDMMDGFKLLREGDSAAFCIPADSIFNPNFGMGYPPFIKQGSNLIFTVKIEEVKSKVSMAEDADKEMQEYIEESKMNFSKTESGMYYVVTVAGKGNLIQLGDNISVHYTGKLLDGNVFDSSVTRNEPFDLVLTEGNMIKGWAEALQMMNKGESATFIMPPSLAYGENGNGPIPPNSPLIFDIQILDVQKGANIITIN